MLNTRRKSGSESRQGPSGLGAVAGLGVLGALAMAAAVARSPNLRDLSVQGNNIGDAGALAFAQAASNLWCLNLSECGISAVGAATVMDELVAKPELISLEASGNADGSAFKEKERAAGGLHVWV